jgi:hypothetical protein
VRCNAKVSFVATSKYELKPFDDLVWPVGLGPKSVSSWQSFLAVQKKEVPNSRQLTATMMLWRIGKTDKFSLFGQ